MLLVDALYADGPLLAWLAYAKGIDVLTPLPSDRLMVGDLLGMARRGMLDWARHRYLRTIQGHKPMRTVEVAAVGDHPQLRTPGSSRWAMTSTRIASIPHGAADENPQTPSRCLSSGRRPVSPGFPV